MEIETPPPEKRKRGRPRKVRLEPPPTSLPPRFKAFIETLEQSDDRMHACDKAGLTWGEVKVGLKTYSELMARYQTVMESRNVRLEDVQYSEGRGGNTTAARAYLQANDPRYRGRGVGSSEEGDGTGEGSTMGESANDWLAAKLESRN